ncbi:MarR family winged helix-turn-helix transcriptional regulator [Tepidibacter mesophilus]|uniref:MarR family winged helix-turn-helix transcriptional regulator n=1 Tax=Tepidibacter mesophilus TaxID=655607 RepID=UPI000C08B71A|nr:MarR family transcriptional regulator [Tepidibacter mesophilus]
MNENVKTLNKLITNIFYDLTDIEKKMFSQGKFNDLSLSEIRTIQAIGMKAPRKMSQVAMVLKITVGTLTISINRLVKKGYVRRFKTEEDRRIVMVDLTEQGKLVYQTHEKFHYEIIENMVSTLNENEQKMLIQSLENICYFFKSK